MIIRPSGDTMLLVEWEQVVDPVVNQRAIALAARLQARVGRQVRDIVPGYCSLGVHFDPLLTDIVALERAIEEEAGLVRDESSPLIQRWWRSRFATAGPRGRISRAWLRGPGAQSMR